MSDASLYTFCSKASGDIQRRGLLSAGRSSTMYSLPSKVQANPKSDILTMPLPVSRRLRHARSLCTTPQEATYSYTRNNNGKMWWGEMLYCARSILYKTYHSSDNLNCKFQQLACFYCNLLIWCCISIISQKTVLPQLNVRINAS